MVEDLKVRLIRALAHAEAYIEFEEDETDVHSDLFMKVSNEVRAVLEDLKRYSSVNTERIREGFQVAILGRPNVGKSTLLNLIAKRDAAIVSDVPGTTRDVIRVALNIAGYGV